MICKFSPEEPEGTIKFQLNFRPAPPVAQECIAELCVWREILFRLGLTGRNPELYDGLAYGNVSQRQAGDRFLISGTQTGYKERLDASDYCLVLAFDFATNWILCEGPTRPSSEALTHAAVYAANQAITHVMHVHSADIWKHHARLGIPATPTQIAYGTPEMARAIYSAAIEDKCPPIICMLGHQDGVVAYGESAEEATLCLVRHLGKALCLNRSD